MSARRGELWLVDFGEPVGREQAGKRPAVVVSADPLNEGLSGVVMVVPLTSARRGLPSHVEIDKPASGLDEVSYAKCEDLKSLSVADWCIALAPRTRRRWPPSSGSCSTCSNSEDALSHRQAPPHPHLPV